MGEASVVVCTYTSERLGLLRETLASLRAQQGVALEVIVVVDGAPELEEELRADPFFAWVKVVPNTGPRGLSAARNSGLSVATRRFVAFIDDDAVADPFWLQRQLAAFEDPAVMVTGGTVLPKLAAPRPYWWPTEFDWVIGCSYPGQLPDPAFPHGEASRAPDARVARVRNVIGASMAFRRRALQGSGGFSLRLGRIDKIPLGGEETEACIRMGQTYGSGAVVLVPGSVVHHHVPAERLSGGYFLRRCYAEGLSKAALARQIKSNRSLSSEATYLLTTLPLAGLRHAFAIFRGDLGGLARAGALFVATCATGLGWLRGHVAHLAGGGSEVNVAGLR